MNRYMFLYCPRCKKKWNLPTSQMKSFSECSICDDKTMCEADYVENIPDPTGILFREGRPTDDA